MKSYLLLLTLPFVFSCSDDAPAANQPKPVIVRDANIPKPETANPYVQVDLSPMDISYLPADYPIKKMNGRANAAPVARVIYSRPQRQGRKVFGNIVKWGEPWRLGANEATEIQLFQPVTIQNRRIEKGQYVLYAVPHEDRWTIHFNSNLFTWGLKFDSTSNVGSFDIPATKKDQQVEYFSMVFDQTADGADLVMAWEDREARLPIQF